MAHEFNLPATHIKVTNRRELTVSGRNFVILWTTGSALEVEAYEVDANGLEMFLGHLDATADFEQVIRAALLPSY